MSKIPFKLMDELAFDRHFRRNYNSNWLETWRQHVLQKNRVDELIRSESGCLSELVAARVGFDHTVHKTLADRLDTEYKNLLNKIERTLHIDDFIPVNDNGKDHTKYFEEALGDGYVHLKLGDREYRATIKLPSYTIIEGVGKNMTVIKLPDHAPSYEWVVTNNNYKEGNRNIQVRNLTLDWNKTRHDNRTFPEGQMASCLTFAKVTFGWIDNVETVDAGLHGIDITSPTYDKSPESNYTADGSRYIWVHNCMASGYGDDGITTHYSEYIWISTSSAMSPKGDAHAPGFSNSNGIEIDDGSKNVWVTDCFTSGNIRGVEVKAHAEYPAAQNVHVMNHVSYNDCRSYDARHIGHHTANDPDSTTAYDVNFINCSAIEPVFNKLYEGLSPCTLVISAYQNVYISNFNQLGDPNYDYQNNAMMRFQYKSRHITVNGFKSRGFKTAEADLVVVGGAQHADKIKITNFDISNSAPIGIRTGSGVFDVSVSNGDISNNNGEGIVGLLMSNNQGNIHSLNIDGYQTLVNIGGAEYKEFVPTIFKGGTIVGTTRGTAYTDSSFIAGSTGGCEAQGERNAIVASSAQSSTQGSRQAIIASNNSHTAGRTNAVESRVIMASDNLTTTRRYTVAGGVNKINWELDSLVGTIKATGSIVGASNVGGIAEWYESLDGHPIASGIIVALEGRYIRPATRKDKRLLGVISETASVLLGESSFHWQGQYLRNKFGGLLFEETEVEMKELYQHIDEYGEMKEDEIILGKEVVNLPKVNPEFVPSEFYASRADRPEWCIVSFSGQVFVRIDKYVAVGDCIAAKNGIGVVDSESQWMVMEITTPFDVQLGYGVAVCFIR